MTQTTHEFYGQTFVNSSDSAYQEWPSAVDFQRPPTLVIKDNDLFFITDQLGNVACRAESQKRTVTGLFSRDTRFLSRSELQIEGESPVLFNSSVETEYSLVVRCTNQEISNLLKPDSIGIKRQILLRGGLLENIEIRNYNTHAVRLKISLSFDADFQDLFEVRNFSTRAARGQKLQAASPQENYLKLAYEGLDNSLMESRIEFVRQPDEIRGNTVIWKLEIASQETIKLGYSLQTYTNNEPNSKVAFDSNWEKSEENARTEWEEWYQKITRIRTNEHSLNRVIEQAEKDLYLLLQSFGEGKVLVAGIPLFSTLFGRDSLIAASQTLMFAPTIAKDTLIALAAYQGTTDSDWRDESPGKILHELRSGELARCQEIPHTPYYGTVDATPLWLMLYADYYAWTGDKETIERLWPNAIAALNWIDSECLETGYLSYLRRSSGGIQNQGWKDSGDSIVNSKGQLAEVGPIALCEVQGYVYAAKTGMSHLAKILERPELAQKWELEAAELKERFNRDFWVESENYCALALDGNGNAIDSVTSNPGHCLQLGIFTPEKAQATSDRLGAKDLFSGWGIRTLSSLSPAYNPMGYHLGSVWPHDSALTAVGLRSLGRVEQAFDIAGGLIDMTKLQPNNRPPELFCGFKREANGSSIQYPVACSPQAWATGSIFQLLQMTVNPIPDAVNNCLILKNPTLPQFIDRLSVQNLKAGSSLIDLDLEKAGDSTICRVVKQQGDLRVLIEA
jgi:glycogen debranching enzyme